VVKLSVLPAELLKPKVIMNSSDSSNENKGHSPRKPGNIQEYIFENLLSVYSTVSLSVGGIIFPDYL
jgi:hypothetical protein